MELLEAGLTYSYWLFRGWRQGVSRGTLGAENVSTVSTMVLEDTQSESLSIKFKRSLMWCSAVSAYLPDSDGKAFPTGHAVLHLVILSPLPGQTLGLLDLKAWQQLQPEHVAFISLIMK